MAKEEAKLNYYNKIKVSKHGGAGGMWFLGFVGTLVYYMHFHSGSFKLVVLAFIKAIFWLPVLVYYLLRFMKI
jgi:hypothetical protein